VVGGEGKAIAFVEFYSQNGNGQFTLTSVNTAVGPLADAKLSFGIDIQDRDLDKVSGTLDVVIDAGSPLEGSSQADVIASGSLGQKIVGGGGGDVLTGGIGSDAFVFNASTEGGDLIKDFQSGDQLHFLASAFGLPSGTATAAAFTSTATDSFTGSEKFHYNSATGTLFFDADGTGVVSNPVLMAVLANKYGLSASDITFVA
jgi:Ca2+-binding RTX toxin-like protein